jgi:tetratricopeptide (TPR) repeat protein
VRQARAANGENYPLIPLLLPGIEPAALGLWFKDAPVATPIGLGCGNIEAALPQLLAAIGRQLPNDFQPPQAHEATPIADLLLELSELAIIEVGDGDACNRCATAHAVLIFDPPAPDAPQSRSTPFRFTAPLGPIEADDLAWYLESYWRWPVGTFAQRAREIEERLPVWGRALFAAALAPPSARAQLAAWLNTPEQVQRRFSVLVNDQLLEGAPPEEQGAASEGATLLLALPWELLHDDADQQGGYLFLGARGARVRRRLPNRLPRDAVISEPPLRVLLLSPRPDDERAAYLDHRVSARPIVDALAPLGELAQLTLLDPPTWPALQAELTRAQNARTPYHVVHFDGHGVYQRGSGATGTSAEQRLGLGALVFEDPADTEKSTRRRSQIISADQLGQTLREHRVPLVFLEACQSAQAELHPTASVAGRLLLAGVASVVAMSHSVLVDTARRFGEVFYPQLLTGARVGQAMLTAQQALYADPCRGKSFDGELRLQDWFVPVLFQEENDPQLVRETPARAVQEQIAKARQLALGKLPPAPQHRFVGRSRELLAAERLLCRQDKDAPRTLVIRGEGGEGKTTVATELARWLVATQRFARAAFVSLEDSGDARAVLWAIGEQLVADFLSKAGRAPESAQQTVERALGDQPTLLVFDNCESVLPPYGWQAGQTDADLTTASALFDPEILDAILALAQRLAAVGPTRIIFTSRQPLPQPFAVPEHTLGRLDTNEAIELVARVLGEGGHLPASADDVDADYDERIAELVETVGGHARSLVLIAGELRTQRVPQTTETLRQIMTDLHRRHPDDRERSLFASVELSLRRLPAELRSKLAPLAVFHGGGQLWVIASVLGLDIEKDEEERLAQALADVGLAEILPYGYLRLDPALAPALRDELSDADWAGAEATWNVAIGRFADYLYQQLYRDARAAATLAGFDLANLLAAVTLRYRTAAEAMTLPADSAPTATFFADVVEIATRLEPLLENLGQRRALTCVVAARECAAQRLNGSGHARFASESATIARLITAGRYAKAVENARHLLECAREAGDTAYPGADYDLTISLIHFGRALRMSGRAVEALAPLADAEQRLTGIAFAGDATARAMGSLCVAERADCLRAIGRFDEAAAAYEEAIRSAKQRGDSRQVAVGKGQVGGLRLHQRRYPEALMAYSEAKQTFAELGEPESVAGAWYQIGIAHRLCQQHQAAEDALKESLAIRVHFGNLAGEAATRNALGNLYSDLGRSEDAVSFFRRAAAIFGDREVRDLANEGRARTNAADDLIRLDRLAEARTEVIRAVECKKPFGHTAYPWLTFNILCKLECAEGKDQAGAQARRQAIAAYLAYRRDGGENPTGSSTDQFCAVVAQAIAGGDLSQIDLRAAQLTELQQLPDLPAYAKPIFTALTAILSGSRDPALADDPDLDYDDAAELLLLLGQLTAHEA